MSRTRIRLLVLAALLALSGCSTTPTPTVSSDPMQGMPGMDSSPGPTDTASAATMPGSGLPGMPPVLDPKDVYAADRPGALSPTVKNDLPRIYVPNHASNTVSVIDPATMKVIETHHVPVGPEHVVPSWDLRTLWVNSDTSGYLTPIDAATGAFGNPVQVDDPYNLYFTPDGRYAVVMAERLHQIVFRDPHTMAVVKTVPVHCDGVNHADFSPDGRYFIATCEFSGDLLKVDTVRQAIVGQQHLPAKHAMPQDIKVSPDGSTWYVADMQTSGLWIFNGDTFSTPTFLATGLGAHGLYITRDSKRMYISNRGEGSISIYDFASRSLVAKWQIPGGGSPDMGNVSADGKVLWLSGRYHQVVYALDANDGHLLAKIPVGGEPHGLCVWPIPGRYSLGHTGIMR
jgi:YVTN family beta-propeller protein